jgi:hypothetical protein
MDRRRTTENKGPEKMPRKLHKLHKLNELLSCYREWHAFVIGFCEVLCPWPPRFKLVSQDITNQVADEYHYYLFGRTIGVITWLGIALGIATIIKEVFF